MATPVNNRLGVHDWGIPAPATRDSALQLWEQKGAEAAIQEANRIQDAEERAETIEEILSGNRDGVFANFDYSPESFEEAERLIWLIEDVGIRDSYVEDLHKLALEAGDGFARIAEDVAEMHSDPDTRYSLAHEARKAHGTFVGEALTSDSSEGSSSNPSDDELDEWKIGIEQANHRPPEERTREMMGVFFDGEDNFYDRCGDYRYVIDYAERIADSFLRDRVLERWTLNILNEEDTNVEDRGLIEEIAAAISDQQIGDVILQQFKEKFDGSEEEISDF